MSELYYANDNVRVFAGKDHQDFLQIAFREPEELFPYTVSLTRYSCPGRYDTYCFDYMPSPSSGIGSRVRFFTDTDTTMLEALRLLQKDLDKKAVIEMALELCRRGRHRAFASDLCYNLLGCLAPRSKTCKEIDKWLKAQRASRVAV